MITAKVAKPMKEFSIAKNKINTLEKNPANGGIPARENKFKIIKVDKTGFIFEKFVHEVRYFKGLFFNFTAKKIDHMLKLIII